MAGLILDTGVLIASERGRQLHQVIDGENDLAIAALSMAELLLGVELAPEASRYKRSVLVTSIVEVVHIEIYDAVVAQAHARLMAQTRRLGQPRAAHDLIIAATAVASGRTLVTTDQRARFDALPGLDVVVVPAS